MPKTSNAVAPTLPALPSKSNPPTCIFWQDRGYKFPW